MGFFDVLVFFVDGDIVFGFVGEGFGLEDCWSGNFRWWWCYVEGGGCGGW